MLKIFWAVAFVFLLFGCTQKTSETNPRDTIWGEQVKTLDKARSVEPTLQEAAERARAADTQQTQ